MRYRIEYIMVMTPVSSFLIVCLVRAVQQYYGERRTEEQCWDEEGSAVIPERIL